MYRQVGTSLYAGVLFSVLGVIAWVSGQPFVFPSLGPSAFVLAYARHGERTGTYRVVGSHVIGGTVGFLAYLLLADGVVLTATSAPLSPDGLRLAASGVLSVVFTSQGMILTDTEHAPACATTLIVSLGLLSTPFQVGVMFASIVVLVGAHLAVRDVVERAAGQYRSTHRNG